MSRPPLSVVQAPPDGRFRSLDDVAAEGPNPGAEDRALSDFGFAERIHDRHGGDLLLQRGLGYRVFDGRRYALDVDGEMTRRAIETARSILVEAANHPSGANRAELAEYALRCESAPRIEAALKLLGAVKGISVEADALDTDPLLFNVANGTLELATKTHREHRREDRISRLSPVPLDPEAKCPLWDGFLARILPNDGVRAYVQRMTGYFVTGLTSEQVVHLLFGSGANGKSVFLRILSELLGDYFCSTPADTFLARDKDGPRNDLAALAGPRMVSAVETEQGRRFAEALVKEVSGGDPITARFLFKEFFTFVPRFKIVIATNTLPVVRGADGGIWRRLRVVPFSVVIPPKERDHRLVEKLRGELPGILNWALEGCLAWQAQGLAPPEDVLLATESYRDDQDAVGRFLADAATLEADAWTSTKALTVAYTEWCSGNSEEPAKPKTLAAALAAHGLKPKTERVNGKNARGWKGVDLRVTSVTVTSGNSSLSAGEGKLPAATVSDVTEDERDLLDRLQSEADERDGLE